jgi:inosose dehydratase
MNIRIACVPLQWGAFSQAEPGAYPRERILREVREAGYEGISSGAQPGQTPAQVLEHLASFGLKPAPGYLGGDWWKPEEQAKAVEQARHAAQFLSEMGVHECFLSANGFGSYTSRRNGKSRAKLAGQVQNGDGLDETEWQVLAETVNRIGAAMMESGVRGCYHNHVGAVVETREEMDKLIAMTDRNCVFLGPDTGHLAWAGADVVQFFRDYAPLIKSVHLKDASEEIRREGAAKQWNYGQFCDAGLWRELGEGDIDFPAIFEILRAQDFNGWMLSETDVTQKDSPLESARISREYLLAQGF